MQFDLISDLNIESWPVDQQVQWQGIGTSLVAVVLGNTSASLNKSYQTLLEISKYYRHVVFVEGDIEHDSNEINDTREIIKEKLKKYQNITYLYRNTIILDSTAFIGSHGWYSFDFCEPYISKQQCFHELIDTGFSQEKLFNQWEMALEDATYMASAIEHCQRDNAVKNIILCTHSVPIKDLLPMPNDTSECTDLGKQGSSFLTDIVNRNLSNKISTWAFGKSCKPIDTKIGNIRYVSNPRGLPNTAVSKYYYPLLVKN